VTAALIQELAAAQEQAEMLGDRDTARLLERAAARVAELEADAACFRWIRSNALWRLHGAGVTWDLPMKHPNISAEHLTDTSVGDELAAAILAAMAPPQEQPPCATA
jgi:hypothetical protein